jgi:hypothetical protein
MADEDDQMIAHRAEPATSDARRPRTCIDFCSGLRLWRVVAIPNAVASNATTSLLHSPDANSSSSHGWSWSARPSVPAP